jgi:biopolymer transport protein TolR
MLRKPRRLMNQINVVPYIDVMLVLLVIFMITAPLINPGQIDLPSVGESLPTPQQTLRVSLHLNGNLTLQDPAKGDADEPITRRELISLLQEKQQRNPDQPVVIAADKNVRYAEVMRLLDLLQQANVKRVGLLANSKGSN